MTHEQRAQRPGPDADGDAPGPSRPLTADLAAHELQLARLLVVHLADAQCHASTLFGGGFGVIPRRGQRLRVTIEDGSPQAGISASR